MVHPVSKSNFDGKIVKGLVFLVLVIALWAESEKTALGGTETVVRGMSELSVDWSATEAGSWILVDANQRECAKGTQSPGFNHLSIGKIANAEELRLVLRPGRGSQSVITIPGKPLLSGLPKPQGSSVIYQLPIRTYFGKGAGRALTGTMNDLSDEVLSSIKQLGVDYLWLTGMIEHASLRQTDPDVVKGDAGSYYAIYDNWDVAGELGNLSEFSSLIERAHNHQLRVLIDLVPNHTARFHRTDIACKQAIDFGRNDRPDLFFDGNNSYYYIPSSPPSVFRPPPQFGAAGRDGTFDVDIFTPGVQLESPARVTGNNIISANPVKGDWFETAKLNYGFDLQRRMGFYEPRPRTWDLMTDVAAYWLNKGVDGFRVDFAHSVPIEFWRYFAAEMKRLQPNSFLLAEAYETDEYMRLPGFSYEALMDAGFDTVFNSDLYHKLLRQSRNPTDVRSVDPAGLPAMRHEVVSKGYQFTQFMENHDEIRAAFEDFSPRLADRESRARLGLAFTAFSALLPGHINIQGGQELEEDASQFGPFAGNDGRTSIFDFVSQNHVQAWLEGRSVPSAAQLRQSYQRLLALKHQPAFSSIHSHQSPTFFDLVPANQHGDQALWVISYVRVIDGEAYVVVLNADPFQPHLATIHFTERTGQDSLGVLTSMGITNDNQRFFFEEVFSQPGFRPVDPAVSGGGLPGWVLYRQGGIPSGLFLGQVPPGSTMVFKVLSAK